MALPPAAPATPAALLAPNNTAAQAAPSEAAPHATATATPNASRDAAGAVPPGGAQTASVAAPHNTTQDAAAVPPHDLAHDAARASAQLADPPVTPTGRGPTVDAAIAVPVAPSSVTSPRATASAAATASAMPAPTSPGVPSKDAARLSEPLKPPPHVEPRQVHWLGRLVDLSVHAGAAVPGGTLFSNVNTNASYGAGLGKELELHPDFAVRGTLAYGYTRLVNKRPQRTGHVGIQMATLRLDLLFGHGRVRPFVGGGVGLYPWVGRITNQQDGASKTRSTSDFGGQVVAGLDWRLGTRFSLAPELSWRRLTGNFSEMLWGAELAARWRL